MKNSLSPKRILLAMLLVGFLLRLYAFSAPIADWHSWRQADTSAVSRNFVKYGFDVLHPRFDDLSNVPSGLDNPNGYRFVEFPLYNILQAGSFTVFGFVTLEQWGRLISSIASLSTAVFLYLLLKKHAGVGVGLSAVFFYLFLPFSIYYGRTILPDTSMVAAIMGGIYFFDKWIEGNAKVGTRKSKLSLKNQNNIHFLLAIVFTAIALLLKPYALFFTVPIVYLAWKEWGFGMVKNWRLWLFAGISLLPVILWRVWMMQYPEGIPANAWLLNGNGIRFRPAFFRWIFYERLIKLISGFAGIILIGLGTWQAYIAKERWFFFSFVLGSLLYICVFATGNVQHDYYQILVLPTVAILYGLGAAYLFGKRYLFKHDGVCLLIVLTALTFYFSGRIVIEYFNINNPVIVTAGKFVDDRVPLEAKVIALYNGDTSFLYQTNRQGWASFQKPLPEMIALGADYLVQLSPTMYDLTLYNRDYEIVASNSAFVLVKLE